MTFKEKFELIKLINSHASMLGMYKQKLHSDNSKPEDYELYGEIAERKLNEILEIIENI